MMPCMSWGSRVDPAICLLFCAIRATIAALKDGVP